MAQAEGLIRTWVGDTVVGKGVGRMVRVVPASSCQAARLVGMLLEWDSIGSLDGR
jgi:hypothetical protein